MSPQHEGLVRSVHVRLTRHAKEIGVDPNHVLTWFAVERFLYRLSRSPHGDRFVLKGALVLLVWLGETLRPTRDADLLGFGDLSDASLSQIFSDVCTVAVEPDGMTYHADTIQVAEIRPSALPLALTPEFAAIQGKGAQWKAFVAKNRVAAPAADLDRVVRALATFLQRPLEAARGGASFDASWTPGGPWR